MREIKFRAWDKKNKRIIYQSLNNHSHIRGSMSFVRFNTCQNICHLGDLELMQYTGLKDKNGTDIYEGDVVRVTGESQTVGTVNKTELIEDMGDVYRNYGLENAIDSGLEVEVIGNKFKNPELLEEK